MLKVLKYLQKNNFFSWECNFSNYAFDWFAFTLNLVLLIKNCLLHFSTESDYYLFLGIFNSLCVGVVLGIIFCHHLLKKYIGLCSQLLEDKEYFINKICTREKLKQKIFMSDWRTHINNNEI